MIKRLVLSALILFGISGCQSNQRAADITLANQASTLSQKDQSQEIPNTNIVTNSNSNTKPNTVSGPNKTPDVQTITLVKTKPDCKGNDCPVIKVKRLNFTGRDRFNTFLDKTMASMVQMESNQSQSFNTFNEFAEYFWRTAKPRDEVVIQASVIRGDENIVVIQLDGYIYSGGAHGMSTTQYINWLPKTDRLLSLETMLLPNKMRAFQALLKKQYDIWLRQNREAISNPDSYKKKWPFVENDNAALLKEGVAITYDPYAIAPYSFGRPTLIVPFKDLKGILRPELLPK